MTSRTYTVLVPTMLLIVGCDLLTSTNGSGMGILYFESEATAQARAMNLAETAGTTDPLDLPILEAPDTVTAGTAFEIMVRTVAPDSCWRADGASVSRTVSMIEVIPYDREEGVNCADAVGRLPRTISLTADETGEVSLRVTGLVLILEDGTVVAERVESIEHQILVTEGS